MTHSSRSRTTLLTAVALLATLAPLATAQPSVAKAPVTKAPASPALLAVGEPGFETGGAAWEFTSGTGVATNNPHSGNRLAYLDAGSGMKVSQTVTATGRGAYVVSAWIATGGPGGRYVLRVNGTGAASLDLPSSANYRRYTLGAITLAPGDRLEIAFESGQGWMNADDVMVSPRPRPAPASPPATPGPPRCSAGPRARPTAGSSRPAPWAPSTPTNARRAAPAPVSTPRPTGPVTPTAAATTHAT